MTNGKSVSVFDQIDQIRRAHASARPKDENPAWKNCHHDCGVLLRAIEELQQAAAVGIASAMPGVSAWTITVCRAEDVPVGTELYTHPAAAQPRS